LFQIYRRTQPESSTLMSRYCEVKTEFKDGRALVEALIETGSWTREQIEVHIKLQHLHGYKGDQRAEKAHIIIRRKHVGTASNDIGFVKEEDGHYKTIISAYDSSKYGSRFIAELKSSYAFHKLHRDQEARGRSVSRTRLSDGRQRVEITGYR